MISITQEGCLIRDEWARKQSVPPRRRQYHQALLIKGRLDLACLERSINEIFRRHEILRARFVSAGERYQQVIEPELSVTLPLVDVGHLPEDEREEEAVRVGTREALKEFDPSKDPVVRAVVVRMSDSAHLLVLILQHLAFDGKSKELFVWELVANYYAFMKGQPPPLPPPAIQFTEFAAQQREYLQGKRLEALLSYWKRQLGGAPVPDLAEVELPFALPYDPGLPYRGATCVAELPPALYRPLLALSRQKRVTPYMTLMALLKAVVYRYTGRHDVSVCTTTSGRERKDVEGVIGRFNYSLMMRTAFPAGATFSDLLERVRESTLGAYEHREIPFSALLDGLRPARFTEPGMTTSDFIWFTFLPDTSAGSKAKMSRFADLGFTSQPVLLNESELAQPLGLMLTAAERADQLNLVLRYRTDRYAEADIERMLRHFKLLAQAAVNDPDRRLDDMPLVDEGERRQLLGWSKAEPAPREPACLHEAFEAQAARTPEAVALVAGERALTYDELNREANRLAHHLRRRGAAAETLVGICMEPSPEFAVAVLGTLKAGAACVLLDARHEGPAAKVLPRNARLKLLLTHRGAHHASEFGDVSVVRLDAGNQNFSQESAKNPGGVAAPLNAAFMRAKPHAPGRPALVAETHEAAANRLAWWREAHPLAQGDRVLLTPTGDFEAAAREMFWPLSCGARLVLPGAAEPGADTIERLIAEQRVSALRTTPQLLSGLLRRAEFDGGASLRQVVCVGEMLSPKLEGRFRARSAAKLSTVYEVAEGSGAVCSRTCAGTGHGYSTVIGRPVQNAEVYLLDARLRPVPVGIPGEVYVGGAGLSRGYHANPAATAQRFVPNPFGTRGGERLYRTGDLARYLPDGAIEYVARADQRVERNGLPFNLRRVEHTLEQHASVETALAALVEEKNAQPRLVAYVVPEPGNEPDFEALRTHLQTRLPTYMIPRTLFVLAEAPLTRAGMIDRGALAASAHTRYDIEEGWVEWP